MNGLKIKKIKLKLDNKTIVLTFRRYIKLWEILSGLFGYVNFENITHCNIYEHIYKENKKMFHKIDDNSVEMIIDLDNF